MDTGSSAQDGLFDGSLVERLQQPTDVPVDGDGGFSGTGRPGDSKQAPSAPLEQRFSPGEELLLAWFVPAEM
ncbi:hypothetical protein [Pseudarthrobacter albicanus]|uniref:hypothetical protein n=1 Tax=Pseudarthrobacter TaxID=1742993 RepID=UPI001BAD1F72|nr:hypothetical protein [Pseudarthrobacter albicanus]